MSSFTTPLDLRADDDGRTFTLISPFDYVEGAHQEGRKFEVPVGFVTDFASVPRVFWNLLPPWGIYGKAAVLHDFLYAVAPFERAHCDRILLEAMGVLGVGWLTRWTIFAGVRVGGWWAWEQHREQLTAAEIKKPKTKKGEQHAESSSDHLGSRLHRKNRSRRRSDRRGGRAAG